MIYIDNILKAKGMTKTDIAKRMDLSRESLYRILSGNPTLDNVIKLANALEIPVSELFANDKSNISGFIKVGSELKEVNSISDIEKLLNEIKGK
ncbi:MAG: helix-turn-helix domain-containing protein [Oscillospiraceae bacterium]|nr:helix-turn-helix domain-containing protein [Oscillospiraceae bacterium]